MTGENCRRFRLLTWTMTSFIGQFVHRLGGDGVNWKDWGGGVVILTSFNFTLSEYMIIWFKIQVRINQC